MVPFAASEHGRPSLWVIHVQTLVTGTIQAQDRARVRGRVAHDLIVLGHG